MLASSRAGFASWPLPRCNFQNARLADYGLECAVRNRLARANGLVEIEGTLRKNLLRNAGAPMQPVALGHRLRWSASMVTILIIARRSPLSRHHGRMLIVIVSLISLPRNRLRDAGHQQPRALSTWACYVATASARIEIVCIHPTCRALRAISSRNGALACTSSTLRATSLCSASNVSAIIVSPSLKTTRQVDSPL